MKRGSDHEVYVSWLVRARLTWLLRSYRRTRLEPLLLQKTDGVGYQCKVRLQGCGLSTTRPCKPKASRILPNRHANILPQCSVPVREPSLPHCRRVDRQEIGIGVIFPSSSLRGHETRVTFFVAGHWPNSLEAFETSTRLSANDPPYTTSSMRTSPIRRAPVSVPSRRAFYTSNR